MSSTERLHPSLNDPKLKLGVFGTNCRNGLIIGNAACLRH
jgi:hypothetical protein